MKIMKTLSVVAALAMSLTFAVTTQAADGRVEKLFNSGEFIVVGHRGFSQVAPENTIPSYELAKAACASMVELDYYVNKDGNLFCFHDGNLNRTTDIQVSLKMTNAPMADLTDKQVKLLDAGKWKSPYYRDVRIPTLEEALKAIQAHGGITLAEHKTGSAKQTKALIQKLDMVDDLVVQSFDWKFLNDMRLEFPEQTTVALGPTSTLNGQKMDGDKRFLSQVWVDAAIKVGVKGVAWTRDVTQEGIDYAHSKGLKVLVWTIDDIPTAHKMIDMGVDGIITDNPALIWKALATKK